MIRLRQFFGIHALGRWAERLSQRYRSFNFQQGMRSLKTPILFAIGLAMTLMFAACSGGGGNNPESTASVSPSPAAQVVRMGYQKFGTLNIVKARGGLEKRLEPLGFSVEWTLFPAGPQLLEGLNVSSIDFGHTGEAPPIFAQAAGTPLVYVGNEPANPGSEAILVPKDSNIKTVADLKGKKVVLNKGSNVHYLLVRAIEDAGLQLSDIETVFLPPADARVAFEQGNVDAWAIWDPFFAAAESAGAKVLRDGKGLVANREFYLGSRTFAEANPQVIQAILDETQSVGEWVKANSDQAAGILAPQVGIDAPILEKVLERRSFGVQTIKDDVAADQQKIADTFSELKLLPKPIQVKEAVWKAN